MPFPQPCNFNPQLHLCKLDLARLHNCQTTDSTLSRRFGGLAAFHDRFRKVESPCPARITLIGDLMNSFWASHFGGGDPDGDDRTAHLLDLLKFSGGAVRVSEKHRDRRRGAEKLCRIFCRPLTTNFTSSVRRKLGPLDASSPSAITVFHERARTYIRLFEDGKWPGDLDHQPMEKEPRNGLNSLFIKTSLRIKIFEDGKTSYIRVNFQLVSGVSLT
ncbi:hypothetical protein QBC38DRAFT_505676 [Podospora fimiseda]|uniref:Uncharacterized protein n=1 Tax=Podospora fimiseda TaxID=252190 RepID=A0AAN6YQH2_9PEZI|nr:hypothetical protein QBC38DRAFT_505676 [Podospora fimiseda]